MRAISRCCWPESTTCGAPVREPTRPPHVTHAAVEAKHTPLVLGGGTAASRTCRCHRCLLHLPVGANVTVRRCQYSQMQLRPVLFAVFSSFRLFVPNCAAAEGEVKRAVSQGTRNLEKETDLSPRFMAERSSDEADGEALYTFTIITMPAAPSIRWLHDRMPAILSTREQVSHSLHLHSKPLLGLPVFCTVSYPPGRQVDAWMDTRGVPPLKALSSLTS